MEPTKKIGPRLIYSVIGIAVVLVAALIALERYIIRNSEIERVRTLVANFVTLQVQNTLRPEYFSAEHAAQNIEFFNEFSKRIRTTEVIRIKIWDKNSAVIFSEDRSIIGKSFPDNDDLKEALGGKISVEISKPDKAENVSEKDYREFMEIYIPAFFGSSSEPSGVIEVYYSMDSINRNVFSAHILTSAVIAGFVIVLLAAFASFWGFR